MKSKGVLFLSNGHGEDAINCQILKALRASGPDVDVSAMSVVGDGAAYSRSTVAIIGPTSKMPSGGVFYLHRRNAPTISVIRLVARCKAGDL